MTVFGSREKGVVLVEFAIAFPILILMFAGTIAFGWLLYQHVLIQRAHFSAARSGAIQSSDCLNFAVTRLEEELRLFGIAFDPNKDVDRPSSGNTISTGPRQLHGFALSLNITLACPFCSLLPALGQAKTYRASVFYPYTDRTECPAP